MTSLIFSYSHKDEDLRDRLETHLVMLKRQGVIDVWHDRRIAAGDEFDHAISDELEQADIILLLVSPDFLASEYCYDVEVKRAMERHESGAARVIPVILRPCDWQSAPFGKLLAAPQDGRPITKWPDLDEAFLDVAKAIRRVAEPPGKQALVRTQQQVAAPARRAKPRSSNLRVKKEFAEVDRDRFMDESYEYMARFFENSLRELATRNSSIDVDFKRIDAQQFTARAYRDGKAIARCKIRLGRPYGSSGEITYSHEDSTHNSGYNESLSVEADEQGLFLRALGMPHFGGVGQEAHLTFEGAAEYYWGLFIAPLQR